MEKIKINRAVIVEGKYDQIKLSSLLDAQIFVTDGFGIFKDTEKQALIRRLAESCGILTATDSDGAGLVIRNFISSIVPPGTVCHLLIPPIRGKEKRKAVPSKEGTIGVEGLDAELLRQLFLPFAAEKESLSPEDPVDRFDLYADGLMGAPDAASKRLALCQALHLPTNLSTTVLLSAINLLGGRKIYQNALGSAEALQTNQEKGADS